VGKPTEVDRRKRYSQFMREAVPDNEWDHIRQAVQRGQLTGNNKFVDEVEQVLGKRVEFRVQGRPAQQAAVEK